MSIALDGNGNSIRGNRKSLADENMERLKSVVAKAGAFYDMNPKQALSHLLGILEAHIDNAEAEAAGLSGSK